MDGWLGWMVWQLQNTIQKGFDSMIHIDSIQGQNPIQADLLKYQTEKPQDYSLERMKGLKRCWSVVFYPDATAYPFNTDEELRDCLYDFCVAHQLKAVLSPLHDMDVNVDGSDEKPHFHFYAVSRRPIYAQLIASLAYFINGGITPIKEVGNELGYYRYMAHLDSPDKAQYNTDDITVINGYVPPASGEKSSAKTTEELFKMVDDFESVRELTAYVIHCRPDLINTLIRARPLLTTYYSGTERQ